MEIYRTLKLCVIFPLSSDHYIENSTCRMIDDMIVGNTGTWLAIPLCTMLISIFHSLQTTHLVSVCYWDAGEYHLLGLGLQTVSLPSQTNLPNVSRNYSLY